MKQTLLSILLIVSCVCAYAHETEDSQAPVQSIDSVETLRIDSVEMDSIEQIIEAMEDTLIVEPAFLQQWNDSSLTDIDFRMMEWAMGWLDTTECVAQADTVVLPDSV